MTKEEKIKEAWGELMPDYTNIDLNSGWSLDDFHEDSYKEDEFHTMQIYEPCKIRPKSLQGIEDNNGWIKIESEEDLPKDGNFWIRKSDGLITLMSVLVLKSIPKKRHSEITHYQPIVKPKPPLYI